MSAEKMFLELWGRDPILVQQIQSIEGQYGRDGSKDLAAYMGFEVLGVKIVFKKLEMRRLGLQKRLKTFTDNKT